MKVSELTFDECRGFLLQRAEPILKTKIHPGEFIRNSSLSVFVEWKMETLRKSGDVEIVIDQPDKHSSFGVYFKAYTRYQDDEENKIYQGDYIGKKSLPHHRWLVKIGKNEFVCQSQRYIQTKGWFKTPNENHEPSLLQILSEGNVKFPELSRQVGLMEVGK